MKIDKLKIKNDSNRIIYYILIPFLYSALSLINYNNFSLIYTATIFLAPLLEIYSNPIQLQDNFYLRKRWLINYGISFLSFPIVTLYIFFLTIYIYNHPNRGLLSNFEPLPLIVEAILATLLVDLIGYIYHRAEHNSFLWRLHQIHHNDSMYDSSLNYRLHPIEVCLFITITLSICVFIIGFSSNAIAVAIVLRVISTIIIHINVSIPDSLDKILRIILVTPKMHFIHHSQRVNETNSNYGVLFSFWDHLFSTHTSLPKLGYNKMNIGLDYEEQKTFTLSQLLIMPFKKRQKFKIKKIN